MFIFQNHKLLNFDSCNEYAENYICTNLHKVEIFKIEFTFYMSHYRNKFKILKN